MRIQILELPSVYTDGDSQTPFIVVISEVDEKTAGSLRLAVKEMPASEVGAKAIWVFEDRVDLGPPLPELKVIRGAPLDFGIDRVIAWGEPELPTTEAKTEAKIRLDGFLTAPIDLAPIMEAIQRDVELLVTMFRRKGTSP